MVYICGVTSRQRLGKYHENLNISLNHSLMPSPTPKTQIPPILAINRGQKDIEPPPAAPPHTKTTEPLSNIRVKSPKKSCSPHICPIWTPRPQKRCREAGRLQPLPEVNLAPLKPLPAVRSRCKVHGGLFWSAVGNFPASLISWTSLRPPIRALILWHIKLI